MAQQASYDNYGTLLNVMRRKKWRDGGGGRFRYPLIATFSINNKKHSSREPNHTAAIGSQISNIALLMQINCFMDRIGDWASKKAIVLFTKSSLLHELHHRYELGVSLAVNEFDHNPRGNKMELALRE